MSARLQGLTYSVRRQVFSLRLFIAACRVYDSAGKLCFIADQKGSGWKHDLRLYTDEAKQNEALAITARQVLGFSAAYDVTDTSTGQKVGVLRRRGVKSMVRDEWTILDANENEIGAIQEDNALFALLRRFVTNLIPQQYQAVLDGETACTFKQNFNPLSLNLSVDFTPDEFRKALDRRLGIAAAVLLCSVEGRQR